MYFLWGSGVLLLVSVLHVSYAQPVLTSMTPRQLNWQHYMIISIMVEGVVTLAAYLLTKCTELRYSTVVVALAEGRLEGAKFLTLHGADLNS